jgi:hypothetical protein
VALALTPRDAWAACIMCNAAGVCSESEYTCEHY